MSRAGKKFTLSEVWGTFTKLVCKIQANSKEEGTESTAPGMGFWQTHTSQTDSNSKADTTTAPETGDDPIKSAILLCAS